MFLAEVRGGRSDVIAVKSEVVDGQSEAMVDSAMSFYDDQYLYGGNQKLLKNAQG